MIKFTMRRQLRYWIYESQFISMQTKFFCNSASVVNLKPSPEHSKQPYRTGLVETVFKSLNNENIEQITQSSNKILPSEHFLKLRNEIKSAINIAQDASTLLTISEQKITHQEALKIMSILTNWASSQKIKLSDYESDNRFKNLCKTIETQSNKIFYTLTKTNQKSEDLHMVLGVSGDDEAAKLISNLNTFQIIKVLSNLAKKKRRSTPLLRAISYNISRRAEILTLKNCVDILYCISILNFLDPVLIDRILTDIEEIIPSNKEKPSYVASIITSIGMLKYKNEKTLNVLLEWIVKNSDIVKPQDITSTVFTMAILNHCPTDCDFNINALFELKKSDFAKSSTWLDYVWSLLVLEKANLDHISSVLESNFIDSLKIDGDLPFVIQKKLCNINGYASLSTDYKGSLLPNEFVNSLQISYTKEKTEFVNLLLETLNSLLASNSNIKKNCNSNMGFIFDATCLLDSKCNPYPVDSENKNKKQNLKRVAMLALDYHDLCKNTTDPIGAISLYKRLLQAQNYHVLFIRYNEFISQDNLASRVQYIEKKLKEIVTKSNNTKV